MFHSCIKLYKPELTLLHEVTLTWMNVRGGEEEGGEERYRITATHDNAGTVTLHATIHGTHSLPFYNKSTKES